MVCNKRLADDGVRGVRVPVDDPVALHVLDDGDDGQAAGARAGRPGTVSGRRGPGGPELDGRCGQTTELDAATAGGRHGCVLHRHAGVRVPRRRLLEHGPRAVHIAVVRGRHRNHRGLGARRGHPIRQLDGRHVPQVPARVSHIVFVLRRNSAKNYRVWRETKGGGRSNIFKTKSSPCTNKISKPYAYCLFLTTENNTLIRYRLNKTFCSLFDLNIHVNNVHVDIFTVPNRGIQNFDI